MKSMVEISHDFLEANCTEGAICVDATLGKGRDTQFFLSFPVQKVYAFEVQDSLIQLAKSIQDDRLILVSKGHQDMDCIQEKVDAIVFNLGYCPGDTHGISTQKETTLVAVRKALDLLKQSGRMAVVCYPHEEGKKEKESILSFLESREDIQVDKIDNQNPRSPMCILIEKNQ